MTPTGTGRGRHTPSPDTRPRPHSEVRPSRFGSSRRTDVPRCSDPRVGVGGGGCTADCSEAFWVWNFSKTLPGLMSPARAAAVPSTPQGSRALEVLRPSLLSRTTMPQTPAGAGVQPGLEGEPGQPPPSPRVPDSQREAESEIPAARHMVCGAGEEGACVTVRTQSQPGIILLHLGDHRQLTPLLQASVQLRQRGLLRGSWESLHVAPSSRCVKYWVRVTSEGSHLGVHRPYAGPLRGFRGPRDKSAMCSSGCTSTWECPQHPHALGSFTVSSCLQDHWSP